MSIVLLLCIAMVENLMAKVKSWEQDKGMLFLYEKVFFPYNLDYSLSQFHFSNISLFQTRLFVMLQEYKVSRQQKEDGKRRSRVRIFIFMIFISELIDSVKHYWLLYWIGA